MTATGDDGPLRALLVDAVSDVEPRSALPAIQARTAASRRRPWLVGAAAAAVLAAAVVGAVAGPDPHPAPAAPAAGTSASSSASSSSSASPSSTASAPASAGSRRPQTPSSAP